MMRTKLTLFLIIVLLGGPAAAAGSPDPDRVTATLEGLRRAVNSHDFGALEPRLADSFTWQGRDPGLSRLIMRQVVEGYPHELAGISVAGVADDDGDWALTVMIESPGGADERTIRMSADYRILQADIADIKLAGHSGSSNAPANDDGALPDIMRFPFVVQKGQTVVQAAINGVAGNFLVDTGAQATTVNTAHFSEEQAPTVALDHAVPSGVGGALSNVRSAPGLELAWGDARIAGLRGLALDLSHLEASLGIPVVGLIGFDVLERFELHFDYDAGLLTLYRLGDENRPVAADLSGAPRATVAFEMLGHIPVLPARIAGQGLKLGLDSGAADAMLFEKWADALSGDYEFVGIEEMRGADKSVRASPEVRFDALIVDNVEYRDILFRFNDILLASGDTPDIDGLLGYAFLSARPTSINFRRRELRIW